MIVGDQFLHAFALLGRWDTDLVEIILLSLRVTGIAVLVATLIGLPIAAALAIIPFPGRRFVIIAFNSLMGLPPVVAGLVVYLILSRSGPLGVLGLLYTPSAMIIAQILVVTPFVIAIARQTIADVWEEYDGQLRSLGAGPWQRIATLLFEARVALLASLLAGFGRGIAEVGGVMIVGGNIDHVTRVMTTAISLETGKGNIALALALGVVLMAVVFIVNLSVALIGEREKRHIIPLA